MQDGKLKVAADGKSVAYDYTASTWKTDTYYFKAGAYVQDDTGPSSVGVMKVACGRRSPTLMAMERVSGRID